jgi:hypothetical protein
LGLADGVFVAAIFLTGVLALAVLLAFHGLGHVRLLITGAA